MVQVRWKWSKHAFAMAVLRPSASRPAMPKRPWRGSPGARPPWMLPCWLWPRMSTSPLMPQVCHPPPAAAAATTVDYLQPALHCALLCCAVLRSTRLVVACALLPQPQMCCQPCTHMRVYIGAQPRTGLLTILDLSAADSRHIGKANVTAGQQHEINILSCFMCHRSHYKNVAMWQVALWTIL